MKNQSNYNTFITSKLGVRVIDTWLDDEDPIKAGIARFIYSKCSGVKPLEFANHPKWKRGYMRLELHEINGIKVIFMPGQPDGMYYLKEDTDILLESLHKGNLANGRMKWFENKLDYLKNKMTKAELHAWETILSGSNIELAQGFIEVMDGCHPGNKGKESSQQYGSEAEELFAVMQYVKRTIEREGIEDYFDMDFINGALKNVTK